MLLRHNGINSLVPKLGGKALYLLCWDTIAGEKNMIYVNITRLSTHHTIPDSQKGNNQKKSSILKWTISSQQKFFTKMKNENETKTKVSF